MVERPSYLRLLVDEAPLPRYDEVLRDAAMHATSAVGREERHAEHELALQLRDLMERQRARHEQQRALVECAKELADVRTDPHRILTLIVTQDERLLGADMAYLSLNDDERRETRLRVMVGARPRSGRTCRSRTEQASGGWSPPRAHRSRRRTTSPTTG